MCQPHAEHEKTEAETYEMPKTVFREKAVGRTQVLEWLRRLKDGRTSLNLWQKATSGLHVLHRAEMMK